MVWLNETDGGFLVHARVKVNDDVDSRYEDFGGDEYDNYRELAFFTLTFILTTRILLYAV